MMGNGRGADCYVQGEAVRDTKEADSNPARWTRSEAARLPDEHLSPDVGVVVGDVHFMNDQRAGVRAPDFAKVADGANGGPMLINVKTSRNVVSIPYQRIHLGINI